MFFFFSAFRLGVRSQCDFPHGSDAAKPIGAARITVAGFRGVCENQSSAIMLMAPVVQKGGVFTNGGAVVFRSRRMRRRRGRELTDVPR